MFFASLFSTLTGPFTTGPPGLPARETAEKTSVRNRAGKGRGPIFRGKPIYFPLSPPWVSGASRGEKGRNFHQCTVFGKAGKGMVMGISDLRSVV